MFGKISAKSVIPMNIFVAAIQISAVIRIMWFMPDATMADFSLAAAILLFSFTYLYVAATQAFNLDPKGLGWYCLPVSVFAVPLGVFDLPVLGVGMAILWWMWASLWFMFFGLLAQGWNIGKATTWWTLINGIATGSAAFAVLNGYGPLVGIYV
jgi:hypothetical protein